ASLLGDGLVDERGDRRVAAVDRGGVDKRLEERADLTTRLRGAVEFAAGEAEAADHGADLHGMVVDGDQGALDSGRLFKPELVRLPAFERLHLDLDHVA